MVCWKILHSVRWFAHWKVNPKGTYLGYDVRLCQWELDFSLWWFLKQSWPNDHHSVYWMISRKSNIAFSEILELQKRHANGPIIELNGGCSKPWFREGSRDRGPRGPRGPMDMEPILWGDKKKSGSWIRSSSWPWICEGIASNPPIFPASWISGITTKQL